jgi:hypothetical protein
MYQISTTQPKPGDFYLFGKESGKVAELQIILEIVYLQQTVPYCIIRKMLQKG